MSKTVYNVEQNTIVHHKTYIRVESWLRWVPTSPITLAGQGMVADRSVMALVHYIRGYLVVRRRDRYDSRAGLGDTGENALRPMLMETVS